MSEIFKKESNFEESLITVLKTKGWEDKVIKNPTEEDLIQNWANILFENNRSIDKLNDAPLTRSEMAQILEQITALRTPLKLNGFINGKTVSITRDNPDDPLHLGKEVSLKIYDRHEIAAGQSRYQIVQQPVFNTASPILNDRRGDILLLINGMPVIHIELKRTGRPLSEACYQLQKYYKEGVFNGIYSLVQIFVAMTPEETVYFANPGSKDHFNKDFYFHWADFNNEPINQWNDVATHLLSIPMAHQLIGFYTVADNSDGILKVMRSYQYYAANAISDKVSKIKWDDKNSLGGYIWHTTGSGKTMTSFKSAQLIANSKDADKVIFLMDRIELGTQSLREYRAFSEDGDYVQGTENTGVLLSKLKSNNPADTLIVTSIQKMSRIEEDEHGFNQEDINKINSKKIVFIIDEAHRSTFGDMLINIKKTFPSAILFGFTGTPIYDKNKKKSSTTAMVFGDELHRYTIADGIRDKNVLGFDPYKINTYKDKDLREQVAFQKANARSIEEVLSSEEKKTIYYHYIDKVKMAGTEDNKGKYTKGIEDYVPKSQYEIETHQKIVVQDIAENWITLSRNKKFHAIFATSSIAEAIDYYRLIKKEIPDMKVTALFDPNIDNNAGFEFKEDGLVEIMQDYNKTYQQDFTLATHAKFKKDISARLSHKKPYERIANHENQQLDLLIVVDQMLTGFDSKWVNTLYLDKLLQYENIIQAFSRTNRLFGPDKPFGTIRYYRKPNTMAQNIENAVKYYSGDRPVDLFAQHLPYNLEKMNQIFKDIKDLFNAEDIHNFEKLPNDPNRCSRFAQLFVEFNLFLEPARIQGFVWEKLEYEFDDIGIIKVLIDENTYLALAQRYKELCSTPSSGGGAIGGSEPFDIDGHLIEIDTGKIDNDYMNSRFDKYLKDLQKGNVDPKELEKTLNELHKSFASLSQEEQKYANIFLHDVQRGEASLEEGKSFREYIVDYQAVAKDNEYLKIKRALGLDIELLKKMISLHLTENNLNEYGRFDELKNSVDMEKAKKYFESKLGKTCPPFIIKRDLDTLLRSFILDGGFDISEN